MRRYLKLYFEADAASGITLLLCVIISLTIANSPFATDFERILSLPVGFQYQSFQLRFSTLHWINDGLMAIFFLLVGIEIKRELYNGQLSSLRNASFPIFGALGGMLMPAMLYTTFNVGTVTQDGWGIPMATDIAFAIGILSILGKRVPIALKVFLTALAIVDDLGAIVVIAVFYTASLSTGYLLAGLGIFVLLLILNRLGIKSLYLYFIPAALMWYFIHHSGVHATIAGVLTAFALPMTGKSPDRPSPILIVEHAIARPVNFLIMPIFALANTNVRFETSMLDDLGSPLSMGIMVGLCIGKPLGITFFSWVGVKSGLSQLPFSIRWPQIFAVSIMGGIGFTMSIFIALLSFENEGYQLTAKFSILVASAIAGLLGYLVLNWQAKRSTSQNS